VVGRRICGVRSLGQLSSSASHDRDQLLEVGEQAPLRGFSSSSDPLKVTLLRYSTTFWTGKGKLTTSFKWSS